MDGISLEWIIWSETLLWVQIHITNDIIHDRIWYFLVRLMLEYAWKLIFKISSVGTVINKLRNWQHGYDSSNMCSTKLFRRSDHSNVNVMWFRRSFHPILQCSALASSAAASSAVVSTAVPSSATASYTQIIELVNGQCSEDVVQITKINSFHRICLWFEYKAYYFSAARGHVHPLIVFPCMLCVWLLSWITILNVKVVERIDIRESPHIISILSTVLFELSKI
jgi:hypothetical protein